jgi:hypothetical protein
MGQSFQFKYVLWRDQWPHINGHSYMRTYTGMFMYEYICINIYTYIWIFIVALFSIEEYSLLKNHRKKSAIGDTTSVLINLSSATQ